MYTFSLDSVSNVYDNDIVALVVDVALSIAALKDAVLKDVTELSS